MEAVVLLVLQALAAGLLLWCIGAMLYAFWDWWMN